MIDAEAAARQWACQQQLVRFFQLLDAKRYDEVAALFDEAGTWHRPGSVLNGRAEILAVLRQRPAQRLTRHVVANFLVAADRGDAIEAGCTLTTYVVEDAKPGRAPLLVESLAGLFSAKVSFRFDSVGPSISRLDLAPDLAFARP